MPAPVKRRGHQRPLSIHIDNGNDCRYRSVASRAVTSEGALLGAGVCVIAGDVGDGVVNLSSQLQAKEPFSVGGLIVRYVREIP